MPEHRVERYHHEPLEFDGALLCRLETDHVPTGDGERWFQLELYQTDGHFVATMRFSSTFDGELSVASAERLDLPADVENFFFAFEPDEFIKRGQVQVSDEERGRLTADLYASYESAVRELLAELPEPEGKESSLHVADASATERDEGAVAK